MMKQLVYIFLILLFSCTGSKQEDQYIQYIDRLDDMKSLHKNNSERDYTAIYDLLNNRTIYRPKVEPFWEKAHQIRLESDSLCNDITTIKKRILSENLRVEELQNKKSKITKEEKEFLLLRIKSYKSKLAQTIERFHESDERIKRIKINLNTYKLIEQTALNNKRSSSLQLYSLLTLIQLKIRETESDLLHYFTYQLDTGRPSHHLVEAIVIPKEKIIKLGEEYQADIFIGSIDTFINSKILVEGQELKVDKGKVFYRKKISENDTGKFSEKGVILYVSNSGELDSIPFTIEYTVIK
jgi:hypothetical protein